VIDEPFVNYQERMTRELKELTKKSQDMVSRSNISLTASEGGGGGDPPPPPPPPSFAPYYGLKNRRKEEKQAGKTKSKNGPLPYLKV